MPILIGLLFVGIFVAVKASAGESVSRRLFNLDDVEPHDQGGKFNQDFDLFFLDAADQTGAPFALIKAHAIQESSLNPRAFMDENPKGLETREGWASRGLMQVLWWPGSDRFKKYGFPDSSLDDGEGLFDAHINTLIGAKIIAENLRSCNGNLRDAVNMYNTGKKEAQFKAPGNYVDRVLKNYNTLLKKG